MDTSKPPFLAHKFIIDTKRGLIWPSFAGLTPFTLNIWAHNTPLAHNSWTYKASWAHKFSFKGLYWPINLILLVKRGPNCSIRSILGPEKQYS